MKFCEADEEDEDNSDDLLVEPLECRRIKSSEFVVQTALWS